MKGFKNDRLQRILAAGHVIQGAQPACYHRANPSVTKE